MPSVVSTEWKLTMMKATTTSNGWRIAPKKLAMLLMCAYRVRRVGAPGPVALPGEDVRFGGTWSTPPGFHGWQRNSRRAASQLPRIAPCRLMAWTAYAEQDG